MIWHWLPNGWHWLVVLVALALLAVAGFALFFGEDEHYVIDENGRWVRWYR